MAIKPMADKAAYEQILWFLESQPKGRILDAPCGQGVLSQCLEEAGHEVFCCDLDPGQMQIREIPFKIAKIPKTTLITYSKDSSHPEKVLTKSSKTKRGILVPRMVILRPLTIYFWKPGWP